MELPLEIDLDKMQRYKTVGKIKVEDFPPDLSNELKEWVKIVTEISDNAIQSLDSNGPYENLLAHLFNLNLNPEKHGWDAWNGVTEEKSTELYEFKPYTKFSASINDDSEKKIKKGESDSQSKTLWLVLAKIDRERNQFSEIYKFPMEIYHEDRMANLSKIVENNKTKTIQTRVTYRINPKKSIKLCEQFNLDYYHWKADA